MRTVAELYDILDLEVATLRDDEKASHGDPRARLRARVTQLDDKQVELLLSLADAMRTSANKPSESR